MVMRIEDQNMLCTEDSSSEDRFGMEKKNETTVEDDEQQPKVWVDSIAKRKPLNRSMSVPEDCIVTGIPSVTELDKLHRERREETERKEVSEAGFSVHDALLSSKVTMIEDMDTHTSSANMIGPKLRIRPQPFPSLHSLDESSTSMASPSIIPSTRDTNMLQPNPHQSQMMIFPHSFTSPHSDRFVLHFPKGAQEQQQDAYQNDDLGLDYDDDDPEVVNIANTNRNSHPQQNNINIPITSSSMSDNAIHVHTTTTTNNTNKQYLQKAGVIRKQPIRLKPKIASRHVPVERVPSLETKAFLSENPEQVTNDDNEVFGENLSLPKIGNSEMRSRMDVIQPRPMRPSSEKAFHQFASNPMVKCDRTLGIVNLQDDPNGSTPVSFGPLSSRASSKPQTDDTTTATPVEKQSLVVKRPLGPEQGRNEGKKPFFYASPPNVPNQLMTSPPKMSIQNQLEMAKSAAARFSGGTNYVNGSKERNGPATVTSADEADPNFRTPPSKFEHSSMMGYLCQDQIVPNRRINTSNLFLPHLSNQDESSQTTPHMTQQVTENQQIQPNAVQILKPHKQDQSTLMDIGD